MITQIKHDSMRSQSGQMVIFFAIAFALFLATLSAIINVGILTRDRIKLQNTVDLASTVGATVQKIDLNYIGELNREIQQTYERYRALLQSPVTASPCYMTNQTCGSTAGTCRLFCTAQDQIYAQSLIAAYNSQRNRYASLIRQILAESSDKSYRFAKMTALAGGNLPADLRYGLEDRYGGSLPNAANMLARYEAGSLDGDYNRDNEVDSFQEIYALHNMRNSVPLFQAEDDIKTLWAYSGANYNMCQTTLAGYDAAAPCFPPLADSQTSFLPTSPVPVPVMVTATSRLKPQVAYALQYAPQFDFNIFKLERRAKPSPHQPYTPGSVLTRGGSSHPQLLFDFLLGEAPTAQGSVLQKMTAIATARPFQNNATQIHEGNFSGATLQSFYDYSRSDQVGEATSFGTMSRPELPFAEHELKPADFLH